MKCVRLIPRISASRILGPWHGGRRSPPPPNGSSYAYHPRGVVVLIAVL